MKAASAETRSFGFCFPHLDTLVQVEASDDGVVIRTSCDSFSTARREAFVRELAAEGFIADAFRWRPTALCGDPGGVRWLVDSSCFQPSRQMVARTRKFMVRLLFAAAGLWLLLLGTLWLPWPR